MAQHDKQNDSNRVNTKKKRGDDNRYECDETSVRKRMTESKVNVH